MDEGYWQVRDCKRCQSKGRGFARESCAIQLSNLLGSCNSEVPVAFLLPYCSCSTCSGAFPSSPSLGVAEAASAAVLMRVMMA